MHTIRTTMQPDREIEVDDAELTDLRRQGLVLDDLPAKRRGGLSADRNARNQSSAATAESN